MKHGPVSGFCRWSVISGLFLLLFIFSGIFLKPRFEAAVNLGGDPALFETMIQEAAARHGISPSLIRSVIQQESNFQPQAVGKAGEIGLMQVTPIAAKDWCRYYGIDYRFRGMLSDPRMNIEVGTWYLAKGLRYWKKYRDQEVLALAEYNAGRSRAREWAPEDPAEKALDRIGFSSTKAYIRNILQFRKQFDQGPTTSSENHR